jgi:hypothetical protein
MTNNLTKFGCLQPFLQLNDDLIHIYQPFPYYLQSDNFCLGHMHTHLPLACIDQIIHEKSSQHPPLHKWLENLLFKSNIIQSLLEPSTNFNNANNKINSFSKCPNTWTIVENISSSLLFSHFSCANYVNPSYPWHYMTTPLILLFTFDILPFIWI